MSKGFFTIAQGDQYLKYAYALALSLKLSQKEYSNLSVGITPGDKIPEKYKEVFDQVIDIPWGDAAEKSDWKLENEWKAIYMSPYEETVKLDADMLFTNDITDWWSAMASHHSLFATDAMTYRNERVESDYYRKLFTQNDIPNVYTAFFYFDKSPASHELFKLAEHIYNNWQRYFFEFLEAEHRPKYVSTDVVFGLAAKILDIKSSIAGIPTFVHMKTELQKWHNDGSTSLRIPEEWDTVIQAYFNDDCELYIGNYRQVLPVHYHLKNFITDEMIATMERKLGLL